MSPRRSLAPQDRKKAASPATRSSQLAEKAEHRSSVAASSILESVPLAQSHVAGLRPQHERPRNVPSNQLLWHASDQSDGQSWRELAHPPQHLAQPDHVPEAVARNVGGQDALARAHLPPGQAKNLGQTRMQTARTAASAIAAIPCQVRAFLRPSTSPVA